MAIPTYVPLIISIFALVLPFLNTLRIFFETAEGYRKCSEAVIGPWSKLRWRRWSWSEFRFETHFVTPKIVLHTISEKMMEQDSYKAYYLRLRDRCPSRHEEGDWTLSPHHLRFSSTKRAFALLQSSAVLDASLTPDFDTRSTRLANPEVGAASDVEKQSEKLLRNEKLHFTSEQRVSWLAFLRHLSKIENLTFTSRKPRPPSPDETPSEYFGAMARLSIAPDLKQQELPLSNLDTGISISFIEWTWDSLPAKATRPMATTSLGTLVVMATRLGMKWRIDLEKDSYQAVGNGYSLSCTQVPEMGLVASFAAEHAEERDYDRSLAFNRSTDMLMCGVIPGARLLVDLDFYCTGDAGTTDILKGVSDVVDSLARLQRKLQPGPVSSGDDVRGLKMLADETMSLLCELPLKPEEGRAGYTYNFPGGILASPPTSDAWLFTLAEEATHFEEIFGELAKLRRRHQTMDEVWFCRRLYDQTTSWFLHHGFGEQHGSHTFYVEFVAAHCLMGHEAWKATSRCLERPRIRSELRSRSRKRTSSEDGDRKKTEVHSPTEITTKTVKINHRTLSWVDKDPPVEIQDRALALMYLEKSSGSRGVLSGYNREMPPNMANGRAWTVLMLRGIAWSRLTRRNSSTSGQAIPSSCWDNQRPVWII